MRKLREGRYASIVKGWFFQIANPEYALILQGNRLMGRICNDRLYVTDKCQSKQNLNDVCLIADAHLTVRRLGDG